MKQVMIDAIYLLIVAALAAALWRSGALIVGQQTAGYQPFEEMLALTASTLGILLISWWFTALLLAFVSEALQQRGHQVAARRVAAVSPEFMKRLAAAVLGLGLVAAPAANAGTPALQSTGISAPAGSVSTGSGELHGPLWQPGIAPEDASPTGPHWHPAPAPADGGLLVKAERAAHPATAAQRGEVVVRPGDSLWTIAAAHLGPMASEAEIAAAWPRWHSSNRAVIGNDPGLLIPGQVLSAPAGP
ncbi:LysM peptidoglycan-binding domain-containing protein [Arthrobacter sp. H5]|uniref:LysM peptidoglycan-binding domain-containing protein n=1 Tax=Arthrobacter sp. H5 TaxID=1267973 RepID=UPI0012DCB487|nr:LysM peptidoglycan-binding domain-containing protein [Arthrobacter sp. H5]